jgi:hypothetical protein
MYHEDTKGDFMKLVTLALTLVALLGLNVSCSERGADLDGIQREEAPLDGAGEEMGEELEEGREEMEEVVD